MTKSKLFGLRSFEAGTASNSSLDPVEKAHLRRLAEVLGRLQLREAARALKERYSSVPFYAERAKNNPQYWRDLALSAVHA